MSELIISWFVLGVVLAVLNAAIVIGTSIRTVAIAMIKEDVKADNGLLVGVSQYLMFIWLTATILRLFMMVITL